MGEGRERGMAKAGVENAGGGVGGSAGVLKKKGAGAKAKVAVLGESNGVGEELMEEVAGGGAGGEKTLEEIYQKKSQLEHILLRPDTYVGSCQAVEQTSWVFDGEAGRMVERPLKVVPGLYKIFDEILVNAADNKARDSTMDTIQVDISRTSNTVRVYNNGHGIPVEMHKTEGVYIPEMIFGMLLTSSNYDDGEKKVTGGRNGYGAKLANIFSTEFVVETVDAARGRKYRQVWRDNMGVKEAPVITAAPKGAKDYTSITFTPDLAKFNMQALDDDIVDLMVRRVYDIAGCLRGAKVYLNGERLPIKSFSDYVGLYLAGKTGPDGKELPRVTERVGDRWEVVTTLSDGQFKQVSFANNIATTRGGTHVAYVEGQITAALLEGIVKKNKGMKIKPFQVKNHLWVFVNSLIENPSFDTQTKENLTLKASAFGSKCELSPDFHKKMAKSGVVQNIVSWAKFKESKEMKKTDGGKTKRIVGIPKLDDANEAGGRNGHRCTLILTEGDSAKSLAVSGLGVVGRDFFGVFPLRGKLLNVRDAGHAQIMDNAELKALKQIIGLKAGEKYDADSVKKLRYGSVMVMTDQDHDGSHIKGLVINFFHHFWPELLKLPGFLLEFITPIVKATKKGGAAGRTAQTETFHTMPEYESWKERIGRAGLKSWSIKYYKGLGTSTAAEAKEYFSALDENRKEFEWRDDVEDADLIDMAFNKKRVEDRKKWISGCTAGTFLDMNANKQVAYSDFINKELVLFSVADLQRSIPNVMDGFKPGQRKVLFCCFKRKLRSDIKVAQMAGYISEHSAYHHGEASLMGTMVGLAQNFVGSNNVNLLVPSGQFGTRLQGGKDSASARYIFTRLSPLARRVFPEIDDEILQYLEEEGQQIEPKWYAPVLPLVLVNGSDGIGTGWSSSIPNYNPADVVANLRLLLADESAELDSMAPWYKGFTGDIEEEVKTGKAAERQGACTSYVVRGRIEIVDNTTVRITELPVRRWTQDYKEFLESMLEVEKGEKEPWIKEYKEHHGDATVDFTVTMTEERLAQAEAMGLEKKFKLCSAVSTTNMTLFDAEGRIRRYDTPQEIIREFYAQRIRVYSSRKRMIVERLEADVARLDAKVRFINAVLSGELVINRKKKVVLLAELESMGFVRMTKSNLRKVDRGDIVSSAAVDADADAGGEDPLEEKGSGASFDYLLGMPLWNLTEEKVASLEAESVAKTEELDTVLATSVEAMWGADLDAFEEALAAQNAEDAELEAQEAAGAAKHGNGRRRAIAGATAPRRPAAAKPATVAKRIAKPAKPVEDAMEISPPRAPAVALRASFTDSEGEDGEAEEAVAESESDGSDAEYEGLSLFERLAKMEERKARKAERAARKAAPAPVAVKKAAPKRPKASSPLAVATARAVDVMSDTMASKLLVSPTAVDSPAYKSAKTAGGRKQVAKPAPRPAAKAAAAPKPKPQPKPKPKAAAAGKKKKSAADSDDEASEFDLDSDSDAEEVTAPIVPREAPRRAAAAKPKVVYVSDASESEEDESEEEEDDDDVSDFEP